MSERVRALVIPASGWWIIQLLEHDMATVTRVFEDVEHATRELFETVERRTHEEGAPSFRTFGPAPEEYLTRFEAAAPLARLELDATTVPGLRIELRLELVSPAPREG